MAVRLVARGVGALRGTLAGEGDFDRRRTGLGFGDLAGIFKLNSSLLDQGLPRGGNFRAQTENAQA